jgi:hypothetical protein
LTETLHTATISGNCYDRWIHCLALHEEVEMTQRRGNPPEPTADDRAAWLLEFLDRDVATLRAGEMLDLGVDVVRYLLDPRAVVVPGAEEAEAVILVKEALRDSGKRPSWIPEGDVTGTEHITADDVMALKHPLFQKLQDTLRQGMLKLANGKPWIPFDDDLLPPKLQVQRRRDGTLGRSYYAGQVLPVLIASALDLLTQFWPQIRRCQYEPCGKFFLPSHGRQAFHSPKCSGLSRQKRFQAEHPRDHKQELVRRIELANKRKAHGKGKKR